MADVAPAATVTAARTVAAAVLLLDRITVLCAAVPTARAFSVTVPIELAAPPGTVVGFRVTLVTTSGFTASVEFAVNPFSVVAVITALVTADTG